MTKEEGLTLAARLGFAARGMVYVLVGWFAVDAALSGRRPSDNQAALGTLADEPLGRTLLVIIAVGLAGYALWRLMEAALDPERKSRTTNGRLERAGYALSGVTHAALAFYAVKLATREQAPAGPAPADQGAQSWSAWLMEQPGGIALVIVVGLALFIVAAAQALKAYRASFLDKLNGEVPAPDYVRTVGRIGFSARAVVFALVGWFFVRSALHANPAEAGGMGRALHELQQQSHGPALLAVVAIGLLLFGVFSLIEARFRYIRIPST